GDTEQRRPFVVHDRLLCRVEDGGPGRPRGRADEVIGQGMLGHVNNAFQQTPLTTRAALTLSRRRGGEKASQKGNGRRALSRDNAARPRERCHGSAVHPATWRLALPPPARYPAGLPADRPG